MFDMEKMGAFIAEKRKDKNLTQGQFADMLSISHQAVSKWERGETMPEISKLNEISKILDMKLEDLLSSCGESTVKSNATSLNLPFNEFIAQIDTLSQSDIDRHLNLYQSEIGINDAILLAPYMSQETLLSTAVRLRAINGNFGIRGLFPFMEQQTADKIAQIGFDEGGFKEIEFLCPYMSADTMKAMASKTFKLYGWQGIKPAIRGMQKDLLGEIVLQAYHLYGMTPVYDTRQFLDKKILADIVDKEVDLVGNWGTIDPVIPNLSQEALLEQAMKFYKKYDISAFNGRFQVLGKEITGCLLNDYIAKHKYIPESWEWVEYILPFGKPSMIQETAMETYNRFGFNGIRIPLRYFSNEKLEELVKKDGKFKKEIERRNHDFQNNDDGFFKFGNMTFGGPHGNNRNNDADGILDEVEDIRDDVSDIRDEAEGFRDEVKSMKTEIENMKIEMRNMLEACLELLKNQK